MSIEIETSDTWPEIVKVLDKYSIEAWRSGALAEQERIIRLLEAEKFILPEGVDEGLTLMPIQDAIALIKEEK